MEAEADSYDKFAKFSENIEKHSCLQRLMRLYKSRNEVATIRYLFNQCKQDVESSLLSLLSSMNLDRSIMTKCTICHEGPLHECFVLIECGHLICESCTIEFEKSLGITDNLGTQIDDDDDEEDDVTVNLDNLHTPSLDSSSSSLSSSISSQVHYPCPLCRCMSERIQKVFM